MHRGSRSSLGGGIFAGQIAGATSRAWLKLFALHTSPGTSLAGVGDTTGAGRRVDSAPLGAIAIVIVVGAMPLQEISSPEGFPTYLSRDISMRNCLWWCHAYLRRRQNASLRCAWRCVSGDAQDESISSSSRHIDTSSCWRRDLWTQRSRLHLPGPRSPLARWPGWRVSWKFPRAPATHWTVEQDSCKRGR